MEILLLFFALPISTIILSIVLQKILKCPILVAATFFAIYLIIAFAIFDSSLLIFVIIYTILAYVTAVITRLVCNILERIRQFNNCCEDNCNNNNSRIGNNNSNCNCSNCCNNNDNNNTNQTRFTLTTNQANPVVYLTNRTNTNARSGCCCRRR